MHAMHPKGGKGGNEGGRGIEGSGGRRVSNDEWIGGEWHGHGGKGKGDCGKATEGMDFAMAADTEVNFCVRRVASVEVCRMVSVCYAKM